MNAPGFPKEPARTADEKIRAVLERIAQELWLTPGIDCEVESEWVPLVSGYLKGRLLSLLLAGQAMADDLRTIHVLPQVAEDCKHGDCMARKAWDAALAAAQDRPETQSFPFLNTHGAPIEIAKPLTPEQIMRGDGKLPQGQPEKESGR